METSRLTSTPYPTPFRVIRNQLFGTVSKHLRTHLYTFSLSDPPPVQRMCKSGKGCLIVPRCAPLVQLVLGHDIWGGA